MRLKYVFFLIAFICTSAHAEMTVNISYKDSVRDQICHEVNSFSRLIELNGFIPNKVNTIGHVDESADIVQPRMIQVYMNMLLLSKQADDIPLACEGFESAALNFSKLYLKYSDNETNIFPWKKNLTGDVSDHPMDIYDLGDWLMISNVYYLISPDKPRTLAYIQDQATFLIETLKNNQIRSFNGDYKTPNLGGREIGHLTLALDSLIISSITMNDEDILRFVSEKVREVSDIRGGSILLEDDKDITSTHLMTYGELFETLFFLDMATQKLGDRNLLFEELYADYKKFFLKKDGILNYYANQSGNQCFNVMAFEAAFYRPLLYFHTLKNENEVNFINHQIEMYEKKLGSIPVYEVCVKSKKKIDPSNKEIHLGGLYGYIKLKRIQQILNLDKNADLKIKKVLDYVNSNSQAIGFANTREDKMKDRGISDVGGNVWYTNEALIPVYHSFFNPNSMLHDLRGSFHGGNYIFINGEAIGR
jgi:hypothetical protein